MRRTKARSKINTVARIIVPTTKGRNVSLISAINSQKVICHQTISTSNVTLNFLFKKLDENNISSAWLILDNARIHKTEEVKELVSRTSHALIFLPVYYPMMNPIEEKFSKVKFSARNLLSDPSNTLSLVEVIDNSMGTVTSTNCYNYFMNMYKKLPMAAAEEQL